MNWDRVRPVLGEACLAGRGRRARRHGPLQTSPTVTKGSGSSATRGKVRGTGTLHGEGGAARLDACARAPVEEDGCLVHRRDADPPLADNREHSKSCGKTDGLPHRYASRKPASDERPEHRMKIKAQSAETHAHDLNSQPQLLEFRLYCPRRTGTTASQGASMGLGGVTQL